MAGPSDGNKKMTKEPDFASQVQEFDFCGESIDLSLRKLLAKVLLPKEAQQIDRAMEDFAKRYYECNPGLVDNPDVVYAVSFSILLLHTDAHNKNVRQKMNKDTFIMRTKIIEGGEGVAQEILDVMYDNIVMSEFTYADGRKESVGRTERSNSWFSKLKSTTTTNDTTIQNSALLLDLGHKLEQLMPAENTFSYKKSIKPIPIMDVHFSLLKAKPLCLAGVRSRYSGDNLNNNNTFTIRVTKAGILDRKYDLIQGGKKATARGWRPFGIILSGSQIIFFADIQSYQNWLDEEEESISKPRRNNSFPAFSSLEKDESTSNLSTVNSITSLYSNNNNTSSIPTTTTTTTSSLLRPVQIVSLSYAICICDEKYTKYPHVFRLITGDGQQFLLRADNDEEMEDWMLKINYAATLKTTGVRMRPTSNTKKNNSIDKLKREDKAKEKVKELSDRIDEQVKLLERELQLRRNLMVLVPNQKSTKDRIISFAETLGKRIKTKRIELQRLECYRDYLESELSWCISQHQQIQSRKLSLPLPTHLYSFTTNNNNNSSTEKDTTIKKLSNLVFTEPSSLEDSVTSKENDIDDDEEEEQVENHSSNNSSNSHISSNNGNTSPQLPAFSFPTKSFVENISFIDVKSASDKVVEMDRIMRRRSQSNPVLPNNRPIDKKLLLLETPKSSGNRTRSGSEASSIKDDDDMSVIIINDSEELLAESNSWPTTTDI